MDVNVGDDKSRTGTGLLRRDAMTVPTVRPSRTLLRIGATLLMIACVSCATSAQRAAYDGFLNRIAEDCRPLVIGSENIGQDLVANGVGADPERYHDFLSATKGLYYGSMPPAVYRNSLTAYLGGGPYNDRSFDCIVGHLPKS